MSKNSMTPAAAVIGAALVGGLSAVGAAHAADNPFGAEQLNGGYLMLAGEGSCGEGKCGEGKCGSKDGGEGKCGDKGEGEGKCGEGKCGGAS
ncbi:HvfA family oxazolone/thioamide-modified RiPP metallophore [Halochromatium sp.]